MIKTAVYRKLNMERLSEILFGDDLPEGVVADLNEVSDEDPPLLCSVGITEYDELAVSMGIPGAYTLEYMLGDGLDEPSEPYDLFDYELSILFYGLIIGCNPSKMEMDAIRDAVALCNHALRVPAVKELIWTILSPSGFMDSKLIPVQLTRYIFYAPIEEQKAFFLDIADVCWDKSVRRICRERLKELNSL